MTLGKIPWNALEQSFKNQVLPNKDQKELPEDIKQMKGIKLICNDILSRAFSVAIHSQPLYDGDKSFTKNCFTFLQKLFSPVLRDLKNSDVEIYVVCLDPLYRSRPEKGYTHTQRNKENKRMESKGANIRLSKPDGQNRYFEDDKPMPGDMRMIKKTPAARASFYDYITRYFQSERFRRNIPDGKQVILSGGATFLGIDENNINLNDRSGNNSAEQHIKNIDRIVRISTLNLPPLRCTNQSCAKMNQIDHSHISEGDLDVWKWIQYFYKLDFHVYSGDGDILLIGFVQMRNILQKNPKRRGWFVTRRSVGTVQRTNQRIDYHNNQYKKYEKALENGKSKQEAFKLSGGVYTSNSRQTKTVWCDRYFNLVGTYYQIMKKQKLIISKNPHLKNKVNLIECYVILLFLTSSKHDYIDRMGFAKGINPLSIWGAFLVDMLGICQLVQIEVDKDDPRKTYYTVDGNILRKWAISSYIQNTYHRIKKSKTNDTDEKLMKARKNSAKRSIKNMPSIEYLTITLSHIVWTLAYYGNNVFPNLKVDNGVETNCNKTNLPIYGYTKGNWAKKVSPGLIRTSPIKNKNK